MSFAGLFFAGPTGPDDVLAALGSGFDALESSAVLSAASSFAVSAAVSAGVVSVAVSFGVVAQAARLRHSTTARSNARNFFMVSFSFLFRQHHTIRQADLARIFSSDQGFGKCRNTVCISNFSNRRAGEKRAVKARWRNYAVLPLIYHSISALILLPLIAVGDRPPSS